MSHYPFGGGVARSLPTGTWVPLARVFPLFWGSLFTLVSPLFQHAVASNRRLRNLAAPRTGRIGHCLKKVAAADSGFPEVPWGFWGIPRWVGLPPPWFLLRICGGFDFWALLGCGWPACPMCVRHTVGLEHSCSLPRWGPGRSIGGSNPCFQHGQGFYTVSVAPALHSSLGPHPKGPLGHAGG